MPQPTPQRPLFYAVASEHPEPHPSAYQAIESYLANLEQDQDPPETLTIVTLTPHQVDRNLFHPLEELLDQLQEKYGNPEDYQKPTQKMRDAEQTFIDTVFAEYKPWTLLVDERQTTVNTNDWVAINSDPRHPTRSET